MAHDLSTAQIDLLLERLSTDKGFHASFAKDPAAALTSIGLPTTLAACMDGVPLASMAAIDAARGEIARLFGDAKTLALSVHHLAAR